jgi:nucleoside-diphosphate-sugar epimerase
MPGVIAVTGATGFIGRHLVDLLVARGDAAIRVLVRDSDAIARTGFRGEVMEGDMRNPAAFARILEEGCTWVNMAHLDLPSVTDQINVMASLLEVCRQKRIKRLVHCSTAVVAGNISDDVVTEATECRPASDYEITKLAIERLLLREIDHGIETAILRPTAVFGPGGMNLVKLAENLLRQPRAVNYARSCLQGRRRMNLVHVDNVVAALAFLIDAPCDSGGEIYIVSDDESPLNNYRDVEQRLARGLGIPYYPLPPIAMPRAALSLALRVIGRTNTNPGRLYDGSKLLQAGFRKPMPLEQGLASFASWYRSFSGTKGEEAP